MVIVSLEDYESLKETAYLLRSPENAKRLLTSINASSQDKDCRTTWLSEAYRGRKCLGGLPLVQAQCPKVLRRINALIKDIARHGHQGIGKPEALKHGFHGYWSRRITDEHRLVYKITDDEIRIAACRYYYSR